MRGEPFEGEHKVRPYTNASCADLFLPFAHLIPSSIHTLLSPIYVNQREKHLFLPRIHMNRRGKYIFLSKKYINRRQK